MCNIYKKHTAFLAIFLALTISVCAQTYTDTIKPFSGATGFRKFSFGINAGVLYPAVATGGSNDYFNPEVSLGYGANLKYQLTHWLALQADFLRGNVTGNNDATYTFTTTTFQYAPRSFETEIHYSGSLNAVFTLGNINWLRMRNWVVPYISLGGGIASWDVMINRTSNGAPNVLYIANDPIREFFAQAAAGLRFPLSRGLNLDLGYRMHYVDADNFDGRSYYTTPFQRGREIHKDKFAYGFLGLEFALGDKNKPQLMFDNPAARMHGDLMNQIDILRSQINLADTDGDGVADIFDKEPNTPAGCPVDTHGVSRDTDGDGVVDCKDQQLITPTECQPVDANGVGKCPPPDCCNRVIEQPNTGCTITDLPSLSFSGSSNNLSDDAKAMLATAANRLKDSPACTVTVTGYPSSSKASQALCNRRTEAIRMWLMNNEGISGNRISTNCEIGGGDSNTIDIKVR